MKIYLEPPAEFDVIGLVRAESGTGFTEQSRLDRALAELKVQAARLGANGVLLTATKSETSVYVGAYHSGSVLAVPAKGQQVEGRAIYVKRER